MHGANLNYKIHQADKLIITIFSNYFIFVFRKKDPYTYKEKKWAR